MKIPNLKTGLARLRLSRLDQALVHLGETVLEGALAIEAGDDATWKAAIMKKNTALGLAIQAYRGTHHKPTRGSPDDV
jgi:hypothetical protein